MVVIPYVQGISEKISRIMKKPNISTAMRPHITLRKSLEHPKDKLGVAKTVNCVYEIPCKSMNKARHITTRSEDLLQFTSTASHNVLGTTLWIRPLSKTKIHCLCGLSHGNKSTRHKGKAYGYRSLAACKRVE